MKTKKLITILLAVLLIASTCVVTAMGYNKSYKDGYIYSAKDSKGYSKMEYMHSPNAHVVITYANNLTNSSFTACIYTYTIKKASGSIVDQGKAQRAIPAGTKSGVAASDCRSKSTNVYYQHKITTSKGTSINRTVG